MLGRLRDLWVVHSRQSLALCESDPNVFVRKRAKLLSETISHSLALQSSVTSVQPNYHFWHSLQSVREFLGFSWRIASKRAGEFQLNQARADRASSNNRRGRSNAPHWFMSEFFFLNQAIHAIADFPGYQHPKALLLQSDKDAVRVDKDSCSRDDASDLHCFWDASRMEIDDLLFRCGAQIPDTKALDGDKTIVLELEHVLKRFCVYTAHLYASYTTAAFNFAGLTLRDWLRMVRELRRADKNLPDLNAARDLFFQVYSQEPSLPALALKENASQMNFRSEGQLQGDVWISKSQFAALLVRVAVAKAQKSEEKKHPAFKPPPNGSSGSLSRRPAQVVADFCLRVVVPTAFQQRERLQAVDFVSKLSCPLVSRVLLEHRAFLRIVFFYYAKQDGDEGSDDDDDKQGRQPQEDTLAKRFPLADNSHHITLQNSVLHGFQLGKTKRNSMNFDEFQAFLAAFELLATHESPPPRLDLASVRLVFCSVMALENGDTTQMEFDEFTSAIAALAMYRDPSPFRLWHVKIDAFVQEMQQLAIHKAPSECVLGFFFEKALHGLFVHSTKPHMKSSTRIAHWLLLLVILVACCMLNRSAVASVRVSTMITSSMDEAEEGPAWVDAPPTAEYEALLARALSDPSNYLASAQRPMCLLSVFALKVQRVDAHHANYLFQMNGCVVVTPTSGGFCRDRSCQPMPFEVQVHAELSALSARDSKLVVQAIRYLD